MKKKINKKSKGLGDTIDKITTATRVKKVVKKIFGDDCGCDERREILNKLFPYKKNNFLTCDEYDYLDVLIPTLGSVLNNEDSNKILTIYRKYINYKQKWTNCVPCWKHIIESVKQLHSEYKTMNLEK